MANIKVLIIDDDDIILSSLTGYLEDENFTCITATNAKEGLNSASDLSIDIAIIDMRLPEIDGNTLIKRLNTINPNLKYIIHTGTFDYTLPKELLDLGLTNENIFHKPIIDMDSFVKAIIKLTGNK